MNISPLVLVASSALAASVSSQLPLNLPVGSTGRTPMEEPFSGPSLRSQTVYTLLGPSARVFRQLGLRREGALPNSALGGQNPGEARQFSSFRISLGRGDASAFGGDLDRNYLSPPVEVFSSAISLPAATNWPSHPMPWDPAFAFPFQTAYTHTGNSDLIVDMRADGGALASGSVWRSKSAYRMDGWGLQTSQTAWANSYSNPRCSGTSATVHIGGRTGATGYGVESAAYLGMTYAPGGQVLIGIGAQGVRQVAQGTPMASSCQPLMVLPLVVIPAATSPQGRLDLFLYRGVHVPAMTGVPVFAQAAYSDPVNLSFQLTNSTELRMPDLPSGAVRALTRAAVPASSSIAIPSLVPQRGLSIQLN